MRRALMLAFFVASAPVLAQDTVPYAYRPPAPSGAYVPTLNYLMADIQTRHIKLWFAGKNGNWELAGYELNQLLGGLNEAVRLYRNIPIADIEATDAPMLGLKDAIKEKVAAQFDTAFAKVTAACNICHHAADIGFIVITTPASSPFSDQSFEPQPK